MRPTFLAAALILTTSALIAPAALAEGPLLASQMPGLEISALATLPAAPPPDTGIANCGHLFVAAPATPAGQATAAKGWSVTAEAPFGPYTAVSFVGAATEATSGACELMQGNVGLWSGTELVALVYARDPKAALVGSITPSGAGLRILSGDLVPGTVADLRLIAGADVAVTPPALTEPVCNRAAEVPFVEGMPIDMARKVLAESGWQPVPQATPSFGMAQGLAEAGITEVEDCAGTGFGFCAYVYSSPAGSLSVITVGEIWEGALPAVVGYSVSCATPSP